jgi:hypothetical protein
MTPEQKAYYQSEINQIRRGGDCNYTAFMLDKIGGMGSSNLGPVQPPVVGFCNNDDTHYVQYLQNWNEVEALIAQLRQEATKAWGEANTEILRSYGWSPIETAPLKGTICVAREFSPGRWVFNHAWFNPVTEEWTDEFGDHVLSPTHWTALPRDQPLPTKPEEA